jgi:hypothetical protein
MALDDRQQTIREGAGLEESRLNTEFIDFLKRWGMHALTLGAVVFGGIALYGRYQKMQAQKADGAFVALMAATAGQESPSPEAMRALAEEHRGVPGVRLLALAQAGDAYITTARKGVRPGVLPKDGQFAASDLLTAAEREEQLTQAAAMYQEVLGGSKDDAKLALHAIGALHGLAAIAETRAQVDQAKAYYEQAAALADKAQHARIAASARAWAGKVGAISEARKLPAAASIPTLPWAAKIEPAPTIDEGPVEGAPGGQVAPAGPELPASPASPAIQPTFKPKAEPDSPTPAGPTQTPK